VAKNATGSLLGRELAAHLDGRTNRRVYDQPDAFRTFVRGGGNVPLYERLSERLARGYHQVRPQSLLDIGCGDGLALAPALELVDHVPARLDLVEPSASLLEAVTATIATVTDVRTWQLTAQEFFARIDKGLWWRAAQATFSLQSVPPADRPGVLRSLREHAETLTIAEFDVPESVEGSDEHLRSLVTRYQRGIAEYGADAHLVAQGFLLPVLLGQVEPGGTRTNWEQPVANWTGQLAGAGFTDVTVEPLADYWWAPAVLITAS
jgi:hypothetical protein